MAPTTTAIHRTTLSNIENCWPNCTM